MEVALAESLQEVIEQQVMQSSHAQFAEDQILQMALKESMAGGVVANLQQQSSVPGTPRDEEWSEGEMLRRAIEMSKGVGNNDQTVIQSQQSAHGDTKYEEIVQIALEYGFNAE